MASPRASTDDRYDRLRPLEGAAVIEGRLMVDACIISESLRSVAAVASGERLLVAPGDLDQALGWTLKREGLCRDEVCVPLVDPGAVMVDAMVDIGAVATALGRPSVIDPEAGLAAIALDSEGRRQALESGSAPDFALPDLDGHDHHLSDWRGRKRLMVAFSSWCGCRYDLPGWQALHEDLEPEGFTAIGVAIDNSPADIRPFTEGISFPVLIDSQHLLTELYAISNVPTVLWIDEEDRIVRPNTVAFGTDTFRDFTKVASDPHLQALRRWVREGELPELAEDGGPAVDDLSEDEVRARLHFRVGAEALRRGDEAVARRHFNRAAELAPYDWTVRRAAMPLVGEDPFGPAFLALYEDWLAAGSPYHGTLAEPTP